MPLIIIEGPDGAGKTTLANTLREKLSGYVAIVRTNSRPGTEEAIMDLTFWLNQSPSDMTVVVDRHPILSEHVYGKIFREGSLTRMTYTEIVREALSIQPTLVIYCNIPTAILQENVQVNKQMEGVTEKIAHIQAWYDLLMKGLEDKGAHIIEHNYLTFLEPDLISYIDNFLMENTL